MAIWMAMTIGNQNHAAINLVKVGERTDDSKHHGWVTTTAADMRGRLQQKREGGSSGQEAMAVAMLVASDKQQRWQQEVVETRESGNSGVTMMSAGVAAADKRRRQWGMKSNGSNGCIGQEALSMEETKNNRGTRRHHTGGQR